MRALIKVNCQKKIAMNTQLQIRQRIILSLTLTIALVIHTVLHAKQPDYKTYQGMVINSKTEKPVVFASIAVEGTSVGTLSNIDGQFTIKVDNTLQGKSLEITHLGYTSQSIAISSLNDAGNVIRLETCNIPLQEVVVHGYNPYELFLEMMKRVKNNYSQAPNMMRGFYRETIKKRGTYIYISEAVVDIYKGSYTKNLDVDRVKLWKGRLGSKVKASDTVMVKLQGGPTTPLMMDIMKNPLYIFTSETIDKYEFKLGEMSTMDNKPVYVLEFNQKNKELYPLYSGKLFIHNETLALLAAEFSLNLDNLEEASSMFISSKPARLCFEPINTYYFVKYKEENGKYFFNYARYELSFTCDYRRRLFKSKYGIMAEMAITDRDETNIVKIPPKDRIGKTTILADNLSAFTDHDFWGKDNYIEPEKNIEEALVKYAKWLKRNNKE
jgi:hypothetical protein